MEYIYILQGTDKAVVIVHTGFYKVLRGIGLSIVCAMMAHLVGCVVRAGAPHSLKITLDAAADTAQLRVSNDIEEGIYEIYAADVPGKPGGGRAEWQLVARDLRGPFSAAQVLYEEDISAQEGTRIYRLGRADIDRDNDLIPDAREGMLEIRDLSGIFRAPWHRAGVRGGIPDYARVIDVSSRGVAGDGQTDVSGALQTTINEAPSETVLYLPAGVYRMNTRIYLRPHMILRGAGADRTRLVFSGPGTSARCIGVVRWNSDQVHPFRAVTTAAVRGASRLTLATVEDFAPGDLVEIQQENRPEWELKESWQAALEGQIARVIAVEKDTGAIQLGRPLRFNIDLQRAPAARKLVTIGGTGIENLAVEKADDAHGYTVEMKYAENCWMRRVESVNTDQAHVWMSGGFENEIRDSFFHGAHNYGGGGHGYGAGCGRHTSDCLIENNVFRKLRHAMIVGIGANGNVFGYNYSADRMPDPQSGNLQADLSVHGNYVFLNLFEGNVIEDADLPDWYHPAGPDNMLFRNRIINQHDAIEVASDGQRALGNDLTYGSVHVDEEVLDVTLDGNIENERVVWLDGEGTILQDSLYRLNRPAFYEGTGLCWPAIGPGCDSSGYGNPSEQRAATGHAMPAP